MSAFFGKLGQWATNYILKFFISYVLDFINAFLERRRAQQARAEQEKKDIDNLKKYQEVIKNGTEAEIDKETDNILNN